MRENNGLARDLDGVERTLIPGVAHINNHSQLVHAVDHVHAEIAKASLGAFRASVPDPVSPVERKLDLPQAEIVEEVQVLQVALNAGAVLHVD